MIVNAEHTAKGTNPRFVVVNVPGDPQELYEQVYCQRGDVENRIKEQQLDLLADRTSCHRLLADRTSCHRLLADRTSCHRLLANQFRLLLSSAAYVLVQVLRRLALGRDRFGASAGGDATAEAVQDGGAGKGQCAPGGV